MKVLICGAGQVGSTIARQLAREGMHVTAIDIDEEAIRRVDENYDVRGILGHGSYPRVLERAGADDADILIAVTRSDEVNMVACQVAYSLFGVKRRIARLRHAGYIAPARQGLYASEHMPIDEIIAPELEIAGSIARRLQTPGAFDMQVLANGRVQLTGIHCDSACRLIGERYLDLGRHGALSQAAILVVLRRGRAFFPGMKDTVELDDDVYLVAPTERTADILECFGHEERAARRVVIVGSGNVGLHLARQLKKSGAGMHFHLIEADARRAEYVARELGDDAVVLHGDALEEQILADAQIGSAETVIAVTNDDETNIFASILAKRAGCARAITLVNKAAYRPLLPTLGLYTVVSPSAVTISTVLRHVRGSTISALHTIAEDFGEVIEFVLDDNAQLTGRTFARTSLPEGVRIGLAIRDGRIIIPGEDGTFQSGDHIVAVVTYEAVQKLQSLIGPRRRGLLG